MKAVCICRIGAYVIFVFLHAFLVLYNIHKKYIHSLLGCFAIKFNMAAYEKFLDLTPSFDDGQYEKYLQSN